MYAAAGGASIASRKARQNKALIKGGAKKPAAKAKPAHKATEKPQSKQFHHLPENYHKHAESLAPPGESLHHSRSLTLRGGENDPPGLRPSRSAHELPSDPGLEPGVVGPNRDHLHHLHQHGPQPVGSPPRAYTCPHWESKLQRTPTDRIVAFGSTDVPYAVCECAQGKAAWQEAAAGAARRCSVVAEGAGTHRNKQNEAHLRWMKRNRIRDLSYGGSSSDEEEGLGARAANAFGGLLYVGLGTVALGLVISFVGTGDKGFKTPELRWTGPALIIAGLFCCFVRIVACCFPRGCRPPRRRSSPKEPAAERLLLSERPPSRPLSVKRLPPLPVDASALSLREQPPPPPPAPTPAPLPVPVLPPAPVPTLLLSPTTPEPTIASASSFDISSISSCETSGDAATVVEAQKSLKLNRTRESVHGKRGSAGCSIPRTVTFADTPNAAAPPSEAPPPAAEIVLTPSGLSR